MHGDYSANVLSSGVTNAVLALSEDDFYINGNWIGAAGVWHTPDGTWNVWGIGYRLFQWSPNVLNEPWGGTIMSWALYDNPLGQSSIAAIGAAMP
jgi:hypothetical protein